MIDSIFKTTWNWTLGLVLVMFNAIIEKVGGDSDSIPKLTLPKLVGTRLKQWAK
jgi:hypothetical protein